MVWAANDINIALDDDETDDDVVTAAIDYRVGRFLIMVEVGVANSTKGTRLEPHRRHPRGDGVRPNDL
jgi:hypothetical protein